MLKEPNDDKPSTGLIIGGVILTILAIPFLLVAACMPAMLVAGFGNFYIAEAVWIGGMLAVAIWRAVTTDNPGIRWTIVAVIAAALIAGAVAVIRDPALIAWWR